MCHDTGLAAILLHFDQIAPARACDFLNHRPCIFIIHIDSHFFDGFEALTAFLTEQNLRAGNRQFKPLAAHVLDQDTHLQFAAPCDLKRLAAGCICHLDGHIRFRLFHQAFTDHAALHLFAIAACKGAVIDAEGHGNRRRVNRLRGDRLCDLGRTDCICHSGLGHTRKGHNIPRFSRIDRLLA